MDDCTTNPKVTLTQFCAACVELHVETHRPATVAFGRRYCAPRRGGCVSQLEAHTVRPADDRRVHRRPNKNPRR